MRTHELVRARWSGNPCATHAQDCCDVQQKILPKALDGDAVAVAAKMTGRLTFER
jgi:hypothetical protein